MSEEHVSKYSILSPSFGSAAEIIQTLHESKNTPVPDDFEVIAVPDLCFASGAGVSGSEPLILITREMAGFSSHAKRTTLDPAQFFPARFQEGPDTALNRIRRRNSRLGRGL